VNDSTPQDPLADIAHLLPPEMQRQRLLEQRAAHQHKAQRSGAVGIGAVLLAILLKFKTALLFLLNFKWVALGAKFLLSFGSLILSIWAWSQIFGLWFAAGFVLLIFVHEMGHVIAIRAYGLKASVPIFIPFIGAFVALKEMPPNSKAAAVIALAGPAVGTAGAMACYFIGLRTGSSFWYALASTAFFINLFNLIPIYPLDGGRVLAALRSAVAPMTHSDRWLLGLQSASLAVLLFMMWHLAGGAAHHG
jgi:Zn-dependent protease